MSDLILNPNPNLPQDVIVEILLRLPVESLVRFRSVSRSWLSLISDPKFTKSHFDRAAAPTHRLLYITPPGDSEARSIDLDASLHDDSPAVNRVLPFPPSIRHPQHVQISGSCRGFVLLYNDPHLFLWNPSTGLHKRISYTAYTSHLIARNLCSAQFSYGFGYDASMDDYLIIIASYLDHTSYTVFEFFSFRTNSWDKFKRGYDLSYPFGSPVSGALHWLATRIETGVGVIVDFDLTKRDLSEIPLPLPLADDSLISPYGSIVPHLSVLEGCLSVPYWCDNMTSLEMWVMKEYNVHSSWTKSIHLSWEVPIRPLWFTKGGEIAGVDNSTCDIVKLNQKGELLEKRGYSRMFRGFYFADMYRESLLSLPSDSSGKAGEDDLVTNNSGA